ncbi:MAG: hypothetical protein GY861_04720 [bacterium]|nr:hypothetical protein [bacterium]
MASELLLLIIVVAFSVQSKAQSRRSEIVINEINLDSPGPQPEGEATNFDKTFVELKRVQSGANFNFFRLAAVHPCPCQYGQECQPQITFWANMHNFKFKVSLRHLIFILCRGILIQEFKLIFVGRFLGYWRLHSCKT